MGSPIVVKIEVPAWMKKFLLYQSENGIEPVEFHRKHRYVLLLNCMLTNRYDTNVVNEPSYNDINSEVVTIRLPWSKLHDVYFYNKISRDNREKFRNEVKSDFYFQYQTEIRNKKMVGIERKQATEYFLDRLNITEDELKYESMYRKFTRYMNKLKLIC
jgi:hypothetical protein